MSAQRWAMVSLAVDADERDRDDAAVVSDESSPISAWPTVWEMSNSRTTSKIVTCASPRLPLSRTMNSGERPADRPGPELPTALRARSARGLAAACRGSRRGHRRALRGRLVQRQDARRRRRLHLRGRTAPPVARDPARGGSYPRPMRTTRTTFVLFNAGHVERLARLRRTALAQQLAQPSHARPRAL